MDTTRRSKHPGAQTRSNTFRTHGRFVDYKDVVRYREHKSARLEDDIARTTRSYSSGTKDCFALLSPSTMLGPMTNPECVLISIRDYYRGSFEVGIWFTTDPRMNCKTTKAQEDAMARLDALSEQCIRACRLFVKNHFQEVGRTLISATSEIKDILSAEHPMTLTYLFAILAYIYQQRRHEVALAILRQFSALAGIMMGERHPLHLICAWLASIHPSQLENMFVKCSVSTGDHFESLVGPMCRSTLVSRCLFIREVDAGREMVHKTSLLQNLLSKCEANLGYFDVRTFEIRLALAFHYLKKRDYIEAIKLGRYILAHEQHLQMSAQEANCYSEGVWIVPNSHYAFDETYSVEMFLREAIDLRMSGWGPYDGRATKWLFQLECWLLRQGHLSSAVSVGENIATLH